LPYNVKIDLPNAGDQDVFIPGLGTFRNGTENEVDDDQALRYRVINAHQESGDPDPVTGAITHETVLAPSIDQIEMVGLTVTRIGGEPLDETVQFTNAREATTATTTGRQLDDSLRAQMQVDQQQAGEPPSTEGIPVAPRTSKGGGK
jgi:hypothetical protein